MSANVRECAKVAAVGPGQTLFEFVRYWSRRSNTAAGRALEQNGRHVLVAEAVASVARRGAATINAVAAEIGIDQSGASRLVKEAAQAGYLETRLSSDDARQRSIALSRRGRRLLVHAHRWQETIFAQLTVNWTKAERSAFHQAMLKLLSRADIAAT